MATIRPNENAPADTVKYCLGSVDFELAPGGEYETEDRAAIADANAHPWLEVDMPELEELSETRQPSHVPYEDDVLSAVNSKAFDVEAIKADIESRREVDESALAVESGLDQKESVEYGGVAVTLAADESDDDNQENE